MILVDYQQAMVTSLTGGWVRKQKFDMDFLRTIFVKRLQTINRKYRHGFGRMVICADNPHYWRRDEFPYYKIHRKAARESSPLDWKVIHQSMSQFYDELVEHFPYQVMKADGAEADDIVAYMVKKYHGDPILIFSGDGDFGQLQKYPKVSQYAPSMQKFIIVGQPELSLKEKIMRGDSGDGIPNFLSDDDTFVSKHKRQLSLRNDSVKEWLYQSPEKFCISENMIRGWKRNQKLIDFDHIPEWVLNNIAKQDIPSENSRQGLISYFMKHKLSQFLPELQDF